MEAPKCQFCGKREWRHVCAGASNAVVNAAKVVVNNHEPVVNAVVNKDRHKTTRKDYFREYMKVWRAVKSGRAELLRS